MFVMEFDIFPKSLPKVRIFGNGIVIGENEKRPLKTLLQSGFQRSLSSVIFRHLPPSLRCIERLEKLCDMWKANLRNPDCNAIHLSTLKLNNCYVCQDICHFSKADILTNIYGEMAELV